MSSQGFINFLNFKTYDHIIDNDTIIITDPGTVDFGNSGIDKIPSNVIFRNRGNVYFEDISSIPPGVIIDNFGFVSLPEFGIRWMDEWDESRKFKGIIKCNKLLNVMIKRGLLE